MTQSIIDPSHEERTTLVNTEGAAIKMNKGEICANCDTELGGQFCHSCGQSSRSMIKFFGEVVKELLDDALGYDSRFKHSLMPLLFKPGRLTLDYVKGKRFHYVLPFKLYLITSVLFILLIKNTTDTDGINFENEIEEKSKQELVQDLSDDKKEQVKNKIEEAVKDIPVIDGELKKEILDSIDENELTVSQTDDEKKKGPTITIGDGSDDIDLNWNSETQQLDGVEEIDSAVLKNFFTQINPKLKEWKKDPDPLVESIIETIPYMMFIILPIFAIFLKLFYILSKRYYTEHLVFLLHNHSFIYMLMMLQIGFEYGEDYFGKMESGIAQFTSSSLAFLSVIFGVWMLVYVFLAMKRFYRQSWKMTIFKTLSLGLIYTILLSFGFALTMAFGAYQA